jgi:hypothetical protein
MRDIVLEDSRKTEHVQIGEIATETVTVVVFPVFPVVALKTGRTSLSL